MSKKNSKEHRRRLHARDIQCEQEEREKQKKAQLKKVEKASITKDKPQHKKHKAIRIRRGVKIRGIKVKDADSKKKLHKVLAQEQALKMAIDDEPQPHRKGIKVSSSKPKVKVPKEVAQAKRAARQRQEAKPTEGGGDSMVIG